MVTNCHLWLPVVTCRNVLLPTVTFCYLLLHMVTTVTYDYLKLPSVTLLPTVAYLPTTWRTTEFSSTPFPETLEQFLFHHLTKRKTLETN